MADIKNISKILIENQEYFLKDENIRHAIAPEYSIENTYNKKDIVFYNDGLYRCIIQISRGETFTPSKWEKVTLEDLFAKVDSPVFTGKPQAPTPSQDDNSSQVANTEFVNTAIEKSLVKINIVRW